MPFPEQGSDLEIMFRKREKGWADRAQDIRWRNPLTLSKMGAPLRYIDERHYEVFKMGDIFREAQAASLGPKAVTWNGHYEFNFEPYMTLSHVADRSWLIRLSLHGNREDIPPQPG